MRAIRLPVAIRRSCWPIRGCSPSGTIVSREHSTVEGATLLARLASQIAHSKTAIDIHPGAEIGHSFFIDHGTGVVIGETTIIGDRVRIYQAVTLGARSFQADEDGVLIKGNHRHPVVENDVVIYAGATILGRITIGAGSVIGGNVWLTQSVPPRSSITQATLRRGEASRSGLGWRLRGWTNVLRSSMRNCSNRQSPAYNPVGRMTLSNQRLRRRPARRCLRSDPPGRPHFRPDRGIGSTGSDHAGSVEAEKQTGPMPAFDPEYVRSRPKR